MLARYLKRTVDNKRKWRFVFDLVKTVNIKLLRIATSPLYVENIFMIFLAVILILVTTKCYSIYFPKSAQVLNLTFL